MGTTQTGSGVEPFAGFNDATIGDIEARIDDEPAGAPREALKEAIREAEYLREDTRKGVLELTEPTVPPAPDGVIEPPLEDTSGRPDLAEVAVSRFDNRKTRVITDDAEKED